MLSLQTQFLLDGFFFQDPNSTIDLINHCIYHMMSVNNIGCGLELSWPPGEFCDKHEDLPPKDWSSGQAANKLCEKLEILILDGFPEMESWHDAVEYIWHYIETHKRLGVDNTDVITRLVSLVLSYM